MHELCYIWRTHTWLTRCFLLHKLPSLEALCFLPGHVGKRGPAPALSGVLPVTAGTLSAATKWMTSKAGREFEDQVGLPAWVCTCTVGVQCDGERVAVVVYVQSSV